MSSTQWMLYTKRADFNKIAARFNIDPVVAKIMVDRDVSEDDMESFLNGTLDDMHDGSLLKDCKKAAWLLHKKIDEKKKIRIVGDYDIDGICSTYILLMALKKCGADVDYEIPDRIKDGYGINKSIIDAAHFQKVDTILTCDNGIAAIDEIAVAKSYSMTVIVTDHHDIRLDAEGSELLPKADAIINPKQKECSYPYKNICGAMVTYKLVKELYKSFDIALKYWEELLCFAAIATVGDVMPLLDENRIVVKEGLRRISSCKNVGLNALIDACGLNKDRLSAYSIGYVLGPCLNAGGRLESAKTSLNLFLSENEDEARELSTHLTMLNNQRKDMTSKGVEDAIKQVDLLYKNNDVLVIYLDDCHESIAGIIAGRIKEKYNKPTIVLTKTDEGLVKGSGRSIEAYHMFDALCEVSDLLLKFGGHPMAAGMSLEEGNVNKLRKRLNENSKLKDEDFIQRLWIDAAMPCSYITEKLIADLDLLEPFGNANEKPAFAQKDMAIMNVRIMGKEQNVIKLELKPNDGRYVDALVFAHADEFLKDMGDKKAVDIIYYPQINEYQGKKQIQLVIKGWKFKEV